MSYASSNTGELVIAINEDRQAQIEDPSNKSPPKSDEANHQARAKSNKDMILAIFEARQRV